MRGAAGKCGLYVTRQTRNVCRSAQNWVEQSAADNLASLVQARGAWCERRSYVKCSRSVRNGSRCRRARATASGRSNQGSATTEASARRVQNMRKPRVIQSRVIRRIIRPPRTVHWTLVTPAEKKSRACLNWRTSNNQTNAVRGLNAGIPGVRRYGMAFAR